MSNDEEALEKVLPTRITTKRDVQKLIAIELSKKQEDFIYPESFSRYENFNRQLFLESSCQPRLEYWRCIYREKMYPCWVIASKGQSDLCIAYSDFGICKEPWGILVNYPLFTPHRPKYMGGDDAWRDSINDVFYLYTDDFPVSPPQRPTNEISVSQKKKNLTKIYSNSHYCGCTFYITNTMEYLQGSTFENCSFRGNGLSVLTMEDCEFACCNFHELNVLRKWRNSRIDRCCIFSLNLCGAQIDDGSLNFICSNSEISCVDLSQTCLEKFPEKLLDFSLKKLNLAINNLLEVPSQITDIKELQELYLCGNKIARLPNMYTMNLKVLTTCGNCLDKIDTPVIPRTLEHLDISHNRIHRFLYEEELTFLDVSGNLITQEEITRISRRYPFAITERFFDWIDEE